MEAQKKEITLFNIFNIPEAERNQYTIRLNSDSTNEGKHTFDPLSGYVSQSDEFKRFIGFYHDKGKRKSRSIRTPFVLQFVKLKESQWLFIGKYEVGQIITDVDEAEYYDMSLSEEFLEFAGRVVFKYKRISGPVNGLYSLEKYGSVDFPNANQHIIDNMVVHHMMDSPFDGKKFPGITEVLLTYKELEQLVLNQNEEWRSALNSVSGIYIQTDLSTGKHYIGAAYSEDGEHTGLWSRLSEYVHKDHSGGNKGLKKLVSEKGPEYIEKNFQYGVLEVFDLKTNPNVVIEREKFWKQQLNTMQNGYNEN